MNRRYEVIMLTMLVTLLMVFSTTTLRTNAQSPIVPLDEGANDFNPFGNETVTVTINAIRSLEKNDIQIPSIKKINWVGKPNFYVKVFINDVEFTSQIWKRMKYVYEPNWSATLDVSDTQEMVQVRIELWDQSLVGNRQCDLSGINEEPVREDRGVNLSYSVKTGHWYGDDSINNMEGWMSSNDPSGYGRLCGSDDGSIYQQDRDCELWFDITQTDPDGDGIPYWSEVHVYHTDPLVDDTGRDIDGDGCPIEWEHKWGHYFSRGWHNPNVTHRWIYNDTIWDDQFNLDPDNDGLTNDEEYRTSQWGSDPFRADLFTELDQMADGPNGETSVFPDDAKELLRTVFDRRNVVYHLDDGTWEETGSEDVPFEANTTYESLDYFYEQYFLHNNQSNWRRGVFHYGLLVYNCDEAGGLTFRSDAFQISSLQMEKKAKIPFLNRNVIYASAYMHETGHTFGFNPIPGHDQDSYYPWQYGWWKWRPYKSVMNYGYMYMMVDYSDGSRGKNDLNDWGSERLDLTYFQGGFY